MLLAPDEVGCRTLITAPWASDSSARDDLRPSRLGGACRTGVAGTAGVHGLLVASDARADTIPTLEDRPGSRQLGDRVPKGSGDTAHGEPGGQSSAATEDVLDGAEGDAVGVSVRCLQGSKAVITMNVVSGQLVI
jgi:hypothetical protein